MSGFYGQSFLAVYIYSFFCLPENKHFYTFQ
jgi:hypothetical protein